MHTSKQATFVSHSTESTLSLSPTPPPPLNTYSLSSISVEPKRGNYQVVTCARDITYINLISLTMNILFKKCIQINVNFICLNK